MEKTSPQMIIADILTLPVINVAGSLDIKLVVNAPGHL
jgi:hypothetical protein